MAGSVHRSGGTGEGHLCRQSTTRMKTDHVDSLRQVPSVAPSSFTTRTQNNVFEDAQEIFIPLLVGKVSSLNFEIYHLKALFILL